MNYCDIQQQNKTPFAIQVKATNQNYCIRHKINNCADKEAAKGS